MKQRYLIIPAMAIALGTTWGIRHFVTASDHDDGSQATSQNNLNLTDLFAFREDNQTGSGGDASNLILIMDSNGHTPAGQQVFFDTKGNYDFHITRVAAGEMDATPTGKEDLILRFKFDEPDASQHQAITLSTVQGGVSTKAAASAGSPAVTTTLTEGQAGKATENRMTVGSSNVSVFAGLREDPFYFDVEQFFKVRAGAAGLGPSATFRTPTTAVDGFAKQNVNSIVVRVPIALLQSSQAEPVFDIWETTSRG